MDGGDTLQHRGGISGDVYAPRNSRQQLLRGGCRGWSTCRENTVASLYVVPRKDIRAPSPEFRTRAFTRGNAHSLIDR